MKIELSRGLLIAVDPSGTIGIWILEFEQESCYLCQAAAYR
jgi:hypothetical protein